MAERVKVTEDMVKEMISYWEDHPELSGKGIGDKFGINATTVRTNLSKHMGKDEYKQFVSDISDKRNAMKDLSKKENTKTVKKSSQKEKVSTENVTEIKEKSTEEVNSEEDNKTPKIKPQLLSESPKKKTVTKKEVEETVTDEENESTSFNYYDKFKDQIKVDKNGYLSKDITDPNVISAFINADKFRQYFIPFSFKKDIVSMDTRMKMLKANELQLAIYAYTNHYYFEDGLFDNDILSEANQIVSDHKDDLI